MTPAPEQQEIQRSNSSDSSFTFTVDDDELSPVEKATLDALTSTLASCNAHLGGSAIGKGFRLASCYYIHNRRSHVLSPLPAGDDDSSSIDPHEILEPGVHHIIEDPFYVVDLGIVGIQLARWRAAFPRVQPFYAIKCNPDPAIVRTLACLGCNFDCASRAEIALVQKISKELPKGYRKPEIIYANPCKSRSHIIDAVCNGVRMVTFDNTAEVRKCASISKKIQLILRIITDDSGSAHSLSSKFGAPKQHWRILLAEAKKFGLEVVGVSFHVGSGCRDAKPYEMALKDCKELFEMAKKEYGFDMKILDIGGGFPGDPVAEEFDLDAVPGHTRKMTELEPIELGEKSDGGEDEEEDEMERKEHKKEHDDDTSTLEREYMYFNEIAEAVCLMLDELFPPTSGVKIIAEPGRYFVAACATLVASIVGVRYNIMASGEVFAAVDEVAMSGNVRQTVKASSQSSLQDDFVYYVNDGVYGALNNLLFDKAHATVHPRKLLNAISPGQSIVEVLVHGEDEDALHTIAVVEEEQGHPQHEKLYSSTVFGPTCKPIDVLCRGVLLPKMNIGDWLYFQNMGAYTSASASFFSGFPNSETFYVCSVEPQHLTRLVTKGT